MTRAQLAHLIEHTQLRAHATITDLRHLCDEAVQHGFGLVSVNLAWASFCSKHLAGKPIGTDVCIGFPLGATTANIKVAEAREAVRTGAAEIDMVINIGALKSGYPNFVEKEIAAVVQAVQGTPVKVILETSYLTDDEKILVCQLSMRAGAAFVKTATGYGQSGATIEDVKLMKQVVGDNLGIKAAGGIRSYAQAVSLLQAGATRLGTSAGLQILADAEV